MAPPETFRGFPTVGVGHKRRYRCYYYICIQTDNTTVIIGVCDTQNVCKYYYRRLNSIRVDFILNSSGVIRTTEQLYDGPLGEKDEKKK